MYTSYNIFINNDISLIIYDLFNGFKHISIILALHFYHYKLYLFKFYDKYIGYYYYYYYYYYINIYYSCVHEFDIYAYLYTGLEQSA